MKSKAEGLSELIAALNGDTEMVLVAVGADAEALTPVVWAKAAYMVQLPATASDADALRVMLQEVLNRGRDAALVASARRSRADGGDGAPHGGRLLRGRRRDLGGGAGGEMQQGHPVLMGRRMIELFLRGQKWSAADEILSANLEHVRTLKAGDAAASPVAPDTAWKAPWD